MKSKLMLSMFFVLSLPIILLATHNQAGNIIFEQIGEKTIKATIITFTKASSVAADRDSLTICWGDGQCETIARTAEALLPNDNKYNEYTWQHQYSNFGSYTISMSDPNRSAGILNISNSENVVFYLETSFILSADVNNSPILLEDPIHLAVVGVPFIHIPNAFDLEGDSIAYELITPMQSAGTSVPDYILPSNVLGSNGLITMQETTGTIEWILPEYEGHFVIAMMIKEYRNGQLISSIVRDMMIDVGLGFVGNLPPEIQLNQQVFQATPGSVVSFDVQIEDPNGDDLIITATGGPFLVDPVAEFIVPQNPMPSPATLTFNWATTAELGRDQPYQVVITAIDGSTGSIHMQKAVQILIDEAPLADKENWKLETINIAPNPSFGITHLMVESEVLRFGRLIILNANGEVVFQKQLNGNSKIPIKTANYVRGVYFIKLQNKNVVGMGKLIIG